MSDSTNIGNVTKPSWLPDELYQQWLNYYIDAGGTGTPGAGDYATELLRGSPQYEQFFPGIKREDGSIRYPNFPEATYLNNLESFRNTLSSAGLNPRVFEEDFINLIEGDVSPQEFNSRVENIQHRVILAGEDIRTFYGENFGFDISTEGIIASLLSDRVSDAVLNRQITMAEIAGEAAQRDFDISRTFVEMLAEQGMDRGEADRLFGSAAAMLPMLGALAMRHGDSADPFDLQEFTEGYLGDPEVQARIERLQATEEAGFTGGAAIDIVRDQRGGRGLTGLAQT